MFLSANLILCCFDVSRCCNRTCRLHVHACSFDHPRSSLNTIILMCAKRRFLLDLIAIWAFIANEWLLKPFQNGKTLFEPLSRVETYEFAIDIFGETEKYMSKPLSTKKNKFQILIVRFKILLRFFFQRILCQIKI